MNDPPPGMTLSTRAATQCCSVDRWSSSAGVPGIVICTPPKLDMYRGFVRYGNNVTINTSYRQPLFLGGDIRTMI